MTGGGTDVFAWGRIATVISDHINFYEVCAHLSVSSRCVRLDETGGTGMFDRRIGAEIA
jgi:hypothetical protein